MWEIELKKYEACFVKYCSESIQRVIKQKSSEIWSENGSSKICQIGRWNYNIGKILFSKEYRMSQIKVKILHKKRLCQKWSFFGRPPNPRASPFSLISLYIIEYCQWHETKTTNWSGNRNLFEKQKYFTKNTVKITSVWN